MQESAEIHPLRIAGRAAQICLADRSLWATALLLGLITALVSFGQLLAKVPGVSAESGGTTAVCLALALLAVAGICSVAGITALLVRLTERALGAAVTPLRIAWRQGWARFIPVFASGILVLLVLYLPVGILSLAAAWVLSTALGANSPIPSLVSSVIGIALGLFAASLSELNLCRVAVAWQAPVPALGQAWRAFRLRPGPLLAVALIQYLITSLLTTWPADYLAGLPTIGSNPAWPVLLWLLFLGLSAAVTAWGLAIWALVHVALFPPPAPEPPVVPEALPAPQSAG